MQASTHSPVRTRKAQSKALAYPDLPEPGPGKHGEFQLAWFLCEAAEQEALQKLLTASYSQRRNNTILQMALCGAIGVKRGEIIRAIKEVAKAGLLPFTHSHTTYFDQQVAA